MESLFGKLFRNFALKMLSVALGAVIYYLVIQAVINLGLSTDDLKLLTATVVALFLAIPYWKSLAKPKKQRAGGEGHA